MKDNTLRLLKEVLDKRRKVMTKEEILERPYDVLGMEIARLRAEVMASYRRKLKE